MNNIKYLYTLCFALLCFLPLSGLCQVSDDSSDDAMTESDLIKNIVIQTGEYGIFDTFYYAGQPGHVNITGASGSYVYELSGGGGGGNGFAGLYVNKSGSWRISGKTKLLDHFAEHGDAGIFFHGSDFSGYGLSNAVNQGLGFFEWLGFEVDGEGKEIFTDRTSDELYMRITRYEALNLCVAEWSLDGVNWNIADFRNRVLNGQVNCGFSTYTLMNKDPFHVVISDVKLEPAKPIAIRSLSCSEYDKNDIVTITLKVENTGKEATAMTLREAIPKGWRIGEAGESGILKENFIEWSKVFAPGITSVSYSITPNPETRTVANFVGDLNSQPVLGQEFLPHAYEISSLPHHGHWRFWNSSDKIPIYPTIKQRSALNNHWIDQFAPSNFWNMNGYEVAKIDKKKRVEIYENRDRQIWSLRRLVEKSSEGFVQVSIENYKDDKWISAGIIQVLPKDVQQPLSKEYHFLLFSPKKDRIISTTKKHLLEFNAESKEQKTLVEYEKTSIGELDDYTISPQGTLWLCGENGLLSVQANHATGDYNIQEYLIPDTLNLRVLRSPISSRNGEVICIAKSLITGANVVVSFSLLNKWNVIYTEPDATLERAWRGADDSIWMQKKSSDTGTFVLSNLSGIKQYDIEPKSILLGNSLYTTVTEEDGSFMLPTTYGIARYSPSVWKIPNNAPDVNTVVHSIYEDLNGRIIFLCSRFTCILRDGEWMKNDYPSIYSTSPLNTDGIIEDLNNKVSIIWQGVQLREENLEKDNNALNYAWNYEGKVRLLAKRGKGGMWALTQNVDNDYEICIYNDDEFDPLITISVKKIDNIIGLPLNLFESSKGELWVCGGYGLGRYANGKWETFEEQFVYKSVIEFPDGLLWFARHNGIYQYDGVEFTPILTEVDEVNSLVISRDGSVWAGTHSGLYRFYENSWVQITKEDGLPDTIVHEVYEDSQGKLWVGTAKGFCFWNPEADRDIPLVTIPEDKNSKTISPDGNAQFVLDGVDKWNYTKPDRLLYSYRIDSDKWSNFSTENVASCSGMLSGYHVIQAKSMDRNWNQSEIKSWTFVVLLPWYKEPFFLLIISISSILIVLLGGVAMYRRKQVLQSYAEIRSANSQLNDMNAELQDVNAQLIQLDKMKTQFVSQASHDLRTPLTAIKGSLDNLLMGIAGALNEKQQKVMTRATTSVDRLTKLINDVLDLNRIETGRIVLEKSDIPFKALVDNIINENSPAAEQKWITFNANLGEEINLHIDGGKIERVVGELISNAIKYTPNDGTVEVDLSCDGDMVSLSVKDSGIGMTAEECSKIWERFYRTAASQKFAKGSGLGLSIAKELVELHGGTLVVESKLGIGTRFTLAIPRCVD